MKQKKIVITGGHLSPSLALADELVKKSVSVVFIGRKSAFKEKTDKSLEYRILSKKKNIRFYTINTGRLVRNFSLTLIFELLKVSISTLYSIKILTVEKPNLIFSFGGYISVPVCLAARLLKIPIYLHEQTIKPGLANKFIAGFASKIYVTFPETENEFQADKTKIVGIPIRESMTQTNNIPSWYVETKKPLVLVLGGSSGSHSINKIIFKNIDQLTKKYRVIHQTGENKFEDYSKAKKANINNYLPVQFIFPNEIGFLINKASIVVSRSGANTFFELIYFKKPSVLIPLPWAAKNEQLLQAEILQYHNVAKIFHQDSDPSKLLQLIDEVFVNRNKIISRFSSLTKYEKLIQQPGEFINKTLS